MDTSGRGNGGNLAANQFACQCRQSIKLILGPAIFDCHVFAFDIAGVFEALTKCAQQVRVRVERCTV
jgi:hypothetical protein